ncbi:MAG: hypothetical protein M3295_06035 [Chloroflexota bacterium]|nr:hypothetical protein [Chloroflexota bacterium]
METPSATGRPDGRGTLALRLDREITALLAGAGSAHASTHDPALWRLIQVAARIRDAMPAVPPGPAFERRLSALLLAPPAGGWFGDGPRSPLQRRLLTGAIGSAAVSVAGVAALAAWRASHRHAHQRP